MKAVICTRYGPPEVLQIQDVPQPTPRDNDVLVKIHATSVHIGDCKIRSLKPGMGPVKDFFFKPMMRIMLGFRGPRKSILGMEFSGTVEAIGGSVTKYRVGDEVFAANDLQFGAYAEYTCIPEDGIISHKPANMSWGEAAVMPNGCMTALMILRKANIQPGQKVLIYGASGSVGTYAVQVAKHAGAEVIGICSTSNLDMVSSLGADRVIDYSKEGFTLDSGSYDVVFDAVGKIPPPKAKTALNEGGVYLNVLSSSNDITLVQKDLLYLKDMVEQGHIKSVIDRTFSIDQIVEAHHYVDQGHKKGNVVVNLD